MTPADVDLMSPDQRRAFQRYMDAELRERRRAHERARRGR